jgi:hypothetical protein
LADEFCKLAWQAGKLLFVEATFGFLLGEGQGALVGGAGFGRFAEPAV